MGVCETESLLNNMKTKTKESVLSNVKQKPTTLNYEKQLFSKEKQKQKSIWGTIKSKSKIKAYDESYLPLPLWKL